MSTENEQRELRMKYAGAIGVLCECSVLVDEDTRDSIEMAVGDWCNQTGWTMTRTLDRVDVMPPTLSDQGE